MPATLEEVSQALDLGPRRVNQLAKEGVIPREARGEYDLLKCLMAYVRYLQRALASKGSMDDDGEVTSSRHERTTLLRIQAERETIELGKAKGDIMSVADHFAILSSLIIETKARVMAIGPRVAPSLVGEESRNMIQAKIEAETKVALLHLAVSTPKLDQLPTLASDAAPVVEAEAVEVAPVAPTKKRSVTKKRARRRPAAKTTAEPTAKAKSKAG